MFPLCHVTFSPTLSLIWEFLLGYPTDMYGMLEANNVGRSSCEWATAKVGALAQLGTCTSALRVRTHCTTCALRSWGVRCVNYKTQYLASHHAQPRWFRTKSMQPQGFLTTPDRLVMVLGPVDVFKAHPSHSHELWVKGARSCFWGSPSSPSGALESTVMASGP